MSIQKKLDEFKEKFKDINKHYIDNSPAVTIDEQLEWLKQALEETEKIVAGEIINDILETAVVIPETECDRTHGTLVGISRVLNNFIVDVARQLKNKYKVGE